MTAETIKKDKVLQIRLSQSEYEKISFNAEKSYKSVSAYMRDRALGLKQSTKDKNVIIHNLTNIGNTLNILSRNDVIDKKLLSATLETLVSTIKEL